MTDLSLPLPSTAPVGRPRSGVEPMALLIGAALILGLACRLLAGMHAPLWFDETFTAEIASQGNPRDLIRWCLGELSGPVYYGMMFAWEKIAGNGDIALRLPSLAASIAAPVLIAWRGHPDRQVRWLWAAVTAVSAITIEQATNARPYALLLLLGGVQATAFMQMIDRPTTRRAMAWTGLSALMVLTHYHAAVLCGMQGVAYLAICRGRAIRTWPAVLPLVPMAVWMAFHLPFLLRFMSGDTVWYQLPGLDLLWAIPWMMTGMAWPGAALLAIMAASFAKDGHAAATRKADWPYSKSETAGFACAALSVALVVGVGFVVPSFTVRYVLPYIPALLLGLAIWTRRMMRLSPLAAAPTLCIMLGKAGTLVHGYIAELENDRRYAFNFEQPSAWIATHDVDRLVMLWDSPTASLPDPDGHIAAVGSFFLRRSQVPVETVVPAWPRTGDPNLLLTRLANARPRTAILWAYDVSTPGTRGIDHPWRIPHIDPRWTCRDFGGNPITVLACVREQ